MPMGAPPLCATRKAPLGRDTGELRVSELALVPGVETHTLFDRNISRDPGTHFLDIVVDGRSFRDVVDGGVGQVT
jgi:hypothetical protein